ncbi:MAG: hypothetical protein K8T10_07625 [Candidatus Eremiobacteraeota bacterium]|nr:hypothetical protein [Candidatus Eremiobacteraeota bacterium]
MILKENDVNKFISLYELFLNYISTKNENIPDILSLKDSPELIVSAMTEARDFFAQNKHFLDEFIETNPYGIAGKDLEIVKSWKHMILGKFVVYRDLKKHTILLSQEKDCKAYGVLGLNNEIIDLIQEKFFLDLPAVVETAILPYKDKIIWDGLVCLYRVVMGGGIKRDLDDTYKMAKAKYGIITSLPFDGKGAESKDERMLEYYLSTRENRDFFWEEIEELGSKSHGLFVLFYQTMGKIHARKIKKALKEEDMRGHFAILYETVVASGSTKKKLEENIRDIVPENQLDLIYKFRLK